MKRALLRALAAAAPGAAVFLRRVRIRRVLLVAAMALFAVIVAGATWLAWPANVPQFADVKVQWTPSDAYLLDRNGVVIDQERIDMRVRRFEWAPLGEVSPALIAAIVDGEDRRFWQHRGVDWTAVLSALRDQHVANRRRGASTISMQVAALLDGSVRAGSSNGAWIRKVQQMRSARALESSWSKQQILEAYVNLTGFRGELQGVSAASQVLAGKVPSGLSLQESLVLAALLPSPGASPSTVASRACARAQSRRVKVDCPALRETATAMLGADTRHTAAAGRGISNPVERSANVAGSSPDWRHIEASADLAVLRLAPQLARALLRHRGERVRTTLDADLQKRAAAVLRAHLTDLADRNVRDGAVLVVDNATGEVLVYVASAGPISRARSVDGVRAHRQAGSTLKPFLYELALERRYLTAASLLDDSPITLDTASGIYLPQNYDRDFKGLVSVRTALGSSLNVPAVRTIVLVGVEPFRERLKSLGYDGLTQSGDFYGYSLALGSAEVSLWEQVQAYRALARGGRLTPIRVTAAERAVAANEQSLLQEAPAFIVADILSDRAARSVTFGLDNSLNTPFWSAVKTGTSKDMRDNWCIGFSRSFTVGVWVGNFEGDSMHEVSGVSGAAPVWQEIMLALHARLPSPAPELPRGVVTARAQFTPAVEPSRRELYLADTATPVVASGGIARISNPANGMVIAIDPDIPPTHQRVPLSAQGHVEGMVLRLNDTLVGPAESNVMWAPRPGTYLLALEDSAGHRLDVARFTVR
jgi:penicillin-binding protein 1C